MKAMIRLTLWVTVITHCLITGYPVQGFSNTLEGRLIHLKVKGPDEMRNLMESFLTDQNLIITDDEDAGILKVDAERVQRGTNLKCYVEYQIKTFKLILPKVGTVYSSDVIWKADDTDRKEDASRNSLKLLRKKYLDQNDKLIAGLNEVAAQRYYEIKVNENASDKKFDTIIQMLKMTQKTAPDPIVEKRFANLLKNQEGLQKQLSALALKVASGTGRLSQQSIDNIKLLVRKEKITYQVGDAQTTKSNKTIRAVLIRVPIKSGRMLTRVYRIYSENQMMVLEKPEFFSSLYILQNSTIGPYFKNKKKYLDITAKSYHPEDHAIMLEGCDAAQVYQAARSDTIKKNRIVVVPEYEN